VHCAAVRQVNVVRQVNMMRDYDTSASDAVVARYGVPFARALAAFVKALAEGDRASNGFVAREVAVTEAPALHRRAEQVYAANQQAARRGTLRTVEFDPAKPAKAAGNRLKQLLKERGIKQTELASRLGVAPSVISRVLKHPERSRLATIQSIADAAGIPLKELI
jgi:DNA-binding Xre family transcriptional regulator